MSPKQFLKMADGPVANIPKTGMDAVAGYVDDSGIGITYPEVVATFPNLIHFSISVHGTSAQCGDVEKGALNDWRGYDYGYCDLSHAQLLINTFGRPKKLLVAHHNNVAHICTSDCGFNFRDKADGTQWIDHDGLWDESLLEPDFFIIDGKVQKNNMQISIDGKVIIGNAVDNGNLLCFTLGDNGWDVIDVTDVATTRAHTNNPADTRTYKVS